MGKYTGRRLSPDTRRDCTTLVLSIELSRFYHGCVFADAERIVSKQKLIPHTNKGGCEPGKLHAPAVPNP
jgi:hypothetical protein